MQIIPEITTRIDKYESRLGKNQSLEESRSWMWMELPLLTY